MFAVSRTSLIMLRIWHEENAALDVPHEQSVPLLYSLHLFLFVHKLLLDLGHVIITFDHLCIIVWRSLPWCASCLKLA